MLYTVLTSHDIGSESKNPIAEPQDDARKNLLCHERLDRLLLLPSPDRYHMLLLRWRTVGILHFVLHASPYAFEAEMLPGTQSSVLPLRKLSSFVVSARRNVALTNTVSD